MTRQYKAQQTDDYLIPYAIANRIVNGVTSGLQLLGIALSTTSKDLKPTSRAGERAHLEHDRLLMKR